MTLQRSTPPKIKGWSRHRFPRFPPKKRPTISTIFTWTFSIYPGKLTANSPKVMKVWKKDVFPLLQQGEFLGSIPSVHFPGCSPGLLGYVKPKVYWLSLPTLAEVYLVPIWSGRDPVPSKVELDVSENNGTPKSSILIGFSIIFTIHFGVALFLETSSCG